jgi:UDP-GlcNAc:undecaprenyl-phosphate/decaprenyl-phosphate GlcNAc-1-phosphate transferase
MFYTVFFVILLLVEFAYLRLADQLNIIDKPNQRSSHKHITIRGGGILFPIAAILWFLFFGFQQPIIIVALLLISLISFMDDIMVLSSKIRIIVHFISVSILFWQLNVYDLPWYWVMTIYVLTIGWINAFNFMDGINGISAFYTIVTFGTLYWISEVSSIAESIYNSELMILLLMALVIFSFFNARKRAKTFAGDIGSVSLAFVIAWFLIQLISETGRIEYILFVSVYGIDSVITILYRLKRKENIFQPHRSHLYQYLSNELGLSHVLVSFSFAFAQLVINVFSIYLINTGQFSISSMIITFLALSILYLILRYAIIVKINSKETIKL